MDIACPNSFTRKTKFRFNAARQVNPTVSTKERLILFRSLRVSNYVGGEIFKNSFQTRNEGTVFFFPSLLDRKD